MTYVIDTGDEGGSRGPWLSWASDGSAEKGFKPRSWVLRDKEDGIKTEIIVPAFETGCVLDLDSLKLGWMKDQPKPAGPLKSWNPSIAQAMPRPDNSKKADDKPAWTNALSIRCAIGGGKAATWEQGAFGAYTAFSRLSKKIMEQHPGDNTLPLVKQVGVESREFGGGGSNIPILEIVKWVPRPECLRDMPVIATEPAPVATAAPVAKAAPRPDTMTRAYDPDEIAKAAMADVDASEF